MNWVCVMGSQATVHGWQTVVARQGVIVAFL
jgi:hypothetical protein